MRPPMAKARRLPSGRSAGSRTGSPVTARRRASPLGRRRDVERVLSLAVADEEEAAREVRGQGRGPVAQEVGEAPASSSATTHDAREPEEPSAGSRAAATAEGRPAAPRPTSRCRGTGGRACRPCPSTAVRRLWVKPGPPPRRTPGKGTSARRLTSAGSPVAARSGRSSRLRVALALDAKDLGGVELRVEAHGQEVGPVRERRLSWPSSASPPPRSCETMRGQKSGSGQRVKMKVTASGADRGSPRGGPSSRPGSRGPRRAPRPPRRARASRAGARGAGRPRPFASPSRLPGEARVSPTTRVAAIWSPRCRTARTLSSAMGKGMVMAGMKPGTSSWATTTSRTARFTERTTPLRGYRFSPRLRRPCGRPMEGQRRRGRARAGPHGASDRPLGARARRLDLRHGLRHAGEVPGRPAPAHDHVVLDAHPAHPQELLRAREVDRGRGACCCTSGSWRSTGMK